MSHEKTDPNVSYPYRQPDRMLQSLVLMIIVVDFFALRKHFKLWFMIIIAIYIFHTFCEYNIKAL